MGSGFTTSSVCDRIFYEKRFHDRAFYSPVLLAFIDDSG
jgi:hypothetical protein